MRTLSLMLSMALIAAIQNTHAASYFTLTSTSIRDGARIPVRFGADDKQRACRPGSTEICPCPGQNVSPQLAWTNAPAGTKSFAILMYDVDGQSGAGVSHWVAYNIAPTVQPLGVTCDYVEHTAVLSFAGLRRLGFGGAERESKARGGSTLACRERPRGAAAPLLAERGRDDRERVLRRAWPCDRARK